MVKSILFAFLTLSVAAPAAAQNSDVIEVLPLECNIEQEQKPTVVILLKTNNGWEMPDPKLFENIEEIQKGFAFSLSRFDHSLGFISKEANDEWSLQVLSEVGSFTGTCRDKSELVERISGHINASLQTKLQSVLAESDQKSDQIKRLEADLVDLKIAGNKRVDRLRAEKDAEIQGMKQALAQKALSRSEAEEKLIQKEQKVLRIEQDLREERSKNAALALSLKDLESFIESSIYKNIFLIDAFREGYGYTPADTDLTSYRFNEDVDPNCLKTFLVPQGYIGSYCITNLTENLLPKI